jgi:hypothetical protein
MLIAVTSPYRRYSQDLEEAKLSAASLNIKYDWSSCRLSAELFRGTNSSDI